MPAESWAPLECELPADERRSGIRESRYSEDPCSAAGGIGDVKYRRFVGTSSCEVAGAEAGPSGRVRG